jgi:hypothetical protein
MQDAYGLSKRLPTVPVSLLAAHQIDALSTKRGAAEITASELAGVPDAQDSSLETLRCAVADLLYAVSRIFREKPQDAREYLLLHAAALLRLGPCDRPCSTEQLDCAQADPASPERAAVQPTLRVLFQHSRLGD